MNKMPKKPFKDYFNLSKNLDRGAGLKGNLMASLANPTGLDGRVRISQSFNAASTGLFN